MKTYDELNQRRAELEQQLKALMKDIRPLKKELEQVTETMYRIACDNARSMPVWELRVNPGKTLGTATYGNKEVICSDVTWQQMVDIATKYFADNGIDGWILTENSYKDCGQFQYKDGVNGGPVLGVFDITEDLPHIIRKFDYEHLVDAL